MKTNETLQHVIDVCRACEAECRDAETVLAALRLSDLAHACHECHKECHQVLHALNEGSTADLSHCADLCGRCADQCERHPDHPAARRCAEVCRRNEAVLREVAEA